MYTIINNTTNTRINHDGGWPGTYLEDLLNKGEDIIVMSSYSNTIKVPYSTELNGITEWDWKEYSYSDRP